MNNRCQNTQWVTSCCICGYVAADWSECLCWRPVHHSIKSTRWCLYCGWSVYRAVTCTVAIIGYEPLHRAVKRRHTVPGCVCVYVSLCAWAVDRHWQVFPQEKGADTSLFVTPVSSHVGRAGISTSRWTGLSTVLPYGCKLYFFLFAVSDSSLNLYKCLSADGLDQKLYGFVQTLSFPSLFLVYLCVFKCVCVFYKCVYAVQTNSLRLVNSF